MKIEKTYLPFGFLQLFAGDADADGLLDFPEDAAEDDSGVDLQDEDYADNQKGPEYGDDLDPDVKEPDEKTVPKDDEPEEPTIPPVEEPKPPEKPIQSPEDNARFAEQRRQAAVQAEIDRLKNEDPAFQLAKKLADYYGETPEQMLEKVNEAALAKESKQTGVPVEMLKAQKESDDKVSALETRLMQMEFEGWQRRVNSEGESLKKDYPMLTQDDIIAAQNHLLTVIRNVESPLEEAVHALHGKKIFAAVKEQARQEALAEISGRKPGLIIGGGSKTESTPTLTADERHVAKMMGLSEADYVKYKV